MYMISNVHIIFSGPKIKWSVAIKYILQVLNIDKQKQTL